MHSVTGEDGWGVEMIRAVRMISIDSVLEGYVVLDVDKVIPTRTLGVRELVIGQYLRMRRERMSLRSEETPITTARHCKLLTPS